MHVFVYKGEHMFCKNYVLIYLQFKPLVPKQTPGEEILKSKAWVLLNLHLSCIQLISPSKFISLTQRVHAILHNKSYETNSDWTSKIIIIYVMSLKFPGPLHGAPYTNRQKLPSGCLANTAAISGHQNDYFLNIDYIQKETS